MLPATRLRSYADVTSCGPALADRPVVVVCQKGQKLSQGVAARLRLHGLPAETLEGGFEAWRDSGGLLFSEAALPPRDAAGRTVWVTRAHPKVDPIACPRLIRRFIDPDDAFLFVGASEVEGGAAAFGAAPFDIDSAFLSHRGEGCTFDTMIEEFGLRSAAAR
ncbi:MAG: chromate resistance protein [Rhizobiales bacterium]|nr:chromate resistance protein [Hyphomicrobiales bacterium]